MPDGMLRTLAAHDRAPVIARRVSRRFSRRGHREQLLGVRDAQIGVGQTGQHPGQLAGPLGVLDHADAAGGDRAAGVLGHHQVPVGERGHLRQVGDHEHLVVAGQPGQPPADLHRRLAADPGVDLVEDQRRRAAGAGEDHLDGEHHPGQLAAGGALLQRQRRRARVGEQPQLDLVGAVRARRRRSTPATARVGSPPAGRLGRDRHLDPGVRHRQPGQLDGHLARRTGRPPRARAADSRPASSATSAASRCRSRSSSSSSSSEVSSSASRARARSAQAITPSTSSAYLRVSAAQRGPPLVDRLQPGRVGVERCRGSGDSSADDVADQGGRLVEPGGQLAQRRGRRRTAPPGCAGRCRAGSVASGASSAPSPPPATAW